MKVRPRLVAMGAASMCAAALTFPAIGASAQPADDARAVAALPADGIQDSHDHGMGSQIRKHEGKAPAHGFDRRAPRTTKAASGVRGIDVSGHQGNVNWSAQHKAGKRFAWVKATESTTYTNPYFNQQYNGSYGKGLIRGAYHFATPDTSSGTAQAKYFLAHGGGWSADGKTLPGALDMEYNPYGSTCYGLSKSQMTSWIKAFSDTYHAKTNKYPAIYTSTSWWNKCVSGDFSKTNPLWVARYGSSAGAMPSNWSNYTMWQYSSSPIDQNVFNGSAARLKAFATNHD